MHWAINYIGKPWTRDGFGPDCYHCWGLVWDVYRTHYGIELPKYGIDATHSLAVTREMERAVISTDWTKLDKPEDGCVVAMSMGTHIRHVGVYLSIDGGRVLHAVEGSGVLCQDLRLMSKGTGWNRIEFYKHGDHR